MSLRSLGSLELLLTLPKFINLLKFSIISIGRARNFRNPPSVVPAFFASALPRSKSPSKEGDLGGG